MQKEIGYSYIPNTLIERIAKVRMSDLQASIVCILFLYQYGVFPKECQIQRTHAFLSKTIGISLSCFCKEVQPLIEKHILNVIQGTTADIISFNENYDEWIS